MFTILAGPDETPFHANVDTLSKSPKFRAQFGGDWKENREGLTKLPDHDPETVSRLLDWLNTGDYESPYPDDVGRSKSSEEQAVDLKDSVKTSSVGPAANATTTADSNRENLPKVVPQTCPTKTQAEKYEEWSQRGPSTDPTAAGGFDFEPTLMCHAKLYALADYVCLPDLQNLCYQRLSTAMLHVNRFFPDEWLTENVANLARLVYANTPQETGRIEPLRHFVSSFIAVNISEFVGTGIDDFFHEGGDCVVDVMKKLRDEVSGQRTGLRELGQKIRTIGNRYRNGLTSYID